jgi:WD40 repeat protein
MRNGVTDICWSISGKYIYSGGWDRTINMYESDKVRKEKKDIPRLRQCLNGNLALFLIQFCLYFKTIIFGKELKITKIKNKERTTWVVFFFLQKSFDQEA